MTDAGTVLRRAATARTRKVGETFMVALGADVREFNDVAATIWRSLDGKRSVAAIAETLASDYEVAADEALADALEFADELVAAGFAVPA